MRMKKKFTLEVLCFRCGRCIRISPVQHRMEDGVGLRLSFSIVITNRVIIFAITNMNAFVKQWAEPDYFE